MASVFNPDGTLPLPHSFVQQAAGADPKIYANDVDENFDKLSTAATELKKGFAVESLGPVSEKSQDLGTISGAVTIDLSAGLSVIATVDGATTLAFANVPAGGTVTVLLRLTNGGAYAVTWGMAPRWGNGMAPVLSESGADYIAFYHAEGEWTGLLVTSNVQ